MLSNLYEFQGHDNGENLGVTAPLVGRICPPGWKSVKVYENLGATAVEPVTPVDTSLNIQKHRKKSQTSVS